MELEIDNKQNKNKLNNFAEAQDIPKNTENKKTKLVDELIDKIGLTRYAFRIYFIIALFFLADGGEMIVISLLISRLGNLWHLSHAEKGYLGSAVFLGFFLGAIIAGIISDNYGRKPTFMVGAFVASIFSMASAFSPNFPSLVVFRALFGLGVGMSVPSCLSLATEITPNKFRAIIINGVWFFFPIGEIMAVIVAKYVLSTEDGWKLLLGVVAVPISISSLFCLFINESPRFYLSKKSFGKAFETFEETLEYGEEKIELTDEMKNRIIKEESATEIKANFSTLFSKEYLRLTCQVCSIFFICSFTYYGICFILPQIMEAEENESLVKMNRSDAEEYMYNGLIISALAEIPNVPFTAFISNVKCIGRIRAMAIGFFFVMLSSIFGAAYIKALNISSAFFKFFIGLPFGAIYVYTLEAFPTAIRSTATGVSNACTRLGGILTPIITQMVFSYTHYAPLILYAIISLGGMFISLFLPFETLGRDLG